MSGSGSDPERSPTTRPRLKLGNHLVPGLAAVALFAVLAAVFLRASFGDAAGFDEGASITASIGYAMFNIPGDAVSDTVVSGEGFLVAFILVTLVLDAAIDGAVFLAKYDEGEGGVGGMIADGGREVRDRFRGGDE